jgi:hypothetical protein
MHSKRWLTNFCLDIQQLMWIREEYLEKNHIQLLFEEVFYKATRIYRGLRGI